MRMGRRRRGRRGGGRAVGGGMGVGEVGRGGEVHEKLTIGYGALGQKDVVISRLIFGPLVSWLESVRRHMVGVKVSGGLHAWYCAGALAFWIS